jgi:hypothetical protein
MTGSAHKRLATTKQAQACCHSPPPALTEAVMAGQQPHGIPGRIVFRADAAAGSRRASVRLERGQQLPALKKLAAVLPAPCQPLLQHRRAAPFMPLHSSSRQVRSLAHRVRP